jgi:hypothetical protein
VTPSATPKNNLVKTYQDTSSAGSVSMTRNPPLSDNFVTNKNERSEESTMPITLRNGSNAVQTADDGFTTVKRANARKETPSTSSKSVRKNKQPMIGVRCSSSHPTIIKSVKMESFFISHISPEVAATDNEKSLLHQLKISSLTCTRLKTKFRTYTSFHISVNEEDFHSIHNMGVWPNGCLTAPFYGQINPTQIYSPEGSNIFVAVVPAPPRNKMNKCVNSNSDDGAHGGSS